MKKILITGAKGLCGHALHEKYHNDWSTKRQTPYEACFIGREYGDLTILDNVKRMYDKIQPNYVVHTAATVGGIGGNEAHHGEFFYNNILMNTYMIDQASRHNVEKMIVFSSVCVFPDGQTLTEKNMHNGPVFSSNFSYGYAKRMVDVQVRAYQKQYGIKNYCSVIPGNLFGNHDNYNLDYGHVIPSLIHKLYLAKRYDKKFTAWGNGSSLREFIYVNDLAKIIFDLLDLPELPLRLIVSGPKQYTIKSMVDKLVKIADFNPSEVVWDISKPNGQHSRPSDLSLFYSYFPDFKFTDIDDALRISYDWFVKNYPNIRL